MVDTKLADKDLETSCWELENETILYEIDSAHKIVAGDLKLKVKQTKKDKLNLRLIMTLLKDKDILSKTLFEKVDDIRELRNSQHIGSHRVVKAFSKSDLEEAFSVASEVKAFVKARVKT